MSHQSLPDALEVRDRVPLRSRIKRFVEEATQCLDGNASRGTARRASLDLSIPPHRVITEGLHILAYAPGPESEIGVAYGDGSVGTPLHLRCLTPVSSVAWNEQSVLQLGTLSYRHVEYDAL